MPKPKPTGDNVLVTKMFSITQEQDIRLEKLSQKTGKSKSSLLRQALNNILKTYIKTLGISNMELLKIGIKLE